MKLFPFSFLFFLLLPFLAMESPLSAEHDPFKVTLKGSQANIESFQLRAELKLSRSIDFCRGETMPKKISDWSCHQIEGGKQECETTYQCAFIKRNFSRVTESSRLRRMINSRRISRKGFALVVGKAPFQNRDRYLLAREFERRKALEAQSLRARPSAPSPKTSAPSPKTSASSSRREELARLESQIQRRSAKGSGDEFDEESDDEFDEGVEGEDDLDALAGDDGFEDDDTAEGDEFGDDGLEELARDDEFGDGDFSEDDEDGDDFADDGEALASDEEEGNGSFPTGDGGGEFEIEEPQGEFSDQENNALPAQGKKGKIKWLSFSFSLMKISDSQSNSVTSFDMGWSPLWQFKPHFALRGRLGWHSFSAILVEGGEEESFNIMDYGLSLEYSLFNDLLYLTAGYGMQSWSSSLGGSFSVVSFGLGKNFGQNHKRLIDQAFIVLSNVGNEGSNSEIKLGVNLIF